MEALERGQKRFTGILPELESISYEEGLDKLGQCWTLFSLECWKLRGRPDRSV